MKILFYINAIHQGGAERVMTNLCEYFSGKGHNCVLVTSFVDEWEYPISPKVRRVSLYQNVLNGKIRRNYKLIKKLRDIIKYEKPDVILSFMNEPNIRSIIANIGLKSKCIISVRSDPSLNNGIRSKLIRRLFFTRADGCVFQTEEAKAYFPKSIRDKSIVIMNPVSEIFFCTNKEDYKNIITIGRLTPIKNHKLLINAFSIVSRSFPKQRLLIYGDGEIRDELQKHIDSLQLSEKAKLCGQIRDVPTVLSSAGIFVLSSNHEGMPNALMEALAVGVPCISTDCPCGGPRMLIKDGYNGFLVPCDSEEALANKLLFLLKNDNEAKRIGENGKKDALKFSPMIIYKQWEDYFNDVAKGKTR